MNDTGGVIVAGGLSRRFGCSKAHALWRGQSFLEHVLGALPCEPSAVVLVVRAEQDEGSWPIGRVIHDDPRLAEGPLRGVVLGLEHSERPWNWVLACDLPGVRTQLLRALRTRARSGVHAVVPRWRGRLQPLCALYAREAARALRVDLERGERSIVRAVEALGYDEFDEDACRQLDPCGASFVNVNHPGELCALDSQQPQRSDDSSTAGGRS